MLLTSILTIKKDFLFTKFYICLMFDQCLREKSKHEKNVIKRLQRHVWLWPRSEPRPNRIISYYYMVHRQNSKYSVRCKSLLRWCFIHGATPPPRQEKMTINLWAVECSHCASIYLFSLFGIHDTHNYRIQPLITSF